MNGSSSGMDSLLREIKEHADDVLLILAAFDGVLADYRTDPQSVRLAQERRALMQRLQDVPGVIVGVTSGRRLDDLRERVDVGERAFYVGLHGIESGGPNFVHMRVTPFDYSEALLRVADRLRSVVSRVPGVRIECKGAVIALHTRAAGSRDAIWSRFQLLAAAGHLVNAGSARIIRGHHVLELIADVGHPKADAITAIQQTIQRRYQQRVYTVYVGEDVADDDAFQAVRRRGVGIVVGRRQMHADHHLRTWADVEQLLDEVARARTVH